MTQSFSNVKKAIMNAPKSHVDSRAVTKTKEETSIHAIHNLQGWIVVGGKVLLNVKCEELLYYDCRVL